MFMPTAPKFLSNDCGHVSAIFALTILPLAVGIGFAVDFQMVTTKKVKAQASLDAAVIAGSRMMQTNATEDEVRLKVRQYFQTTLETNEGLLTCDPPAVSIIRENLSASTVCSQSTTLSAIAGVNEVNFDINSASTFGIGKIDVAFVFDVSGSMIGARMDDLKDAAVVAVDQLLPEDPKEGHEDDIRISMVSYNNSLNAGQFFQDATGVSPYGTYRYWHRRYRRWYNLAYHTTCVFQREGSEKFTDEPPAEDDYVTPAGYWDRNDCRGSPPVPLTTDRQTLVDHINSLDPSGGTAGHLGVAWGWYMISPKWKDILPTAPREYDEPDTAKALILMTDGAFNATISNNQGTSTWQAKQLCDN
ncbi:MAG: pilus assembly protein TadG-related protein, partial [Pseudomonadota bacterium]